MGQTQDNSTSRADPLVSRSHSVGDKIDIKEIAMGCTGLKRWCIFSFYELDKHFHVAFFSLLIPQIFSPIFLTIANLTNAQS